MFSLKIGFFAFSIAAMVFAFGARGQEAQTRSARIAEALAKMDSPIAVERRVATEENLNSADGILQSEALVKALHSPDQVIRESALTHLLEDQKLWLVEFTMTDQDFRNLPDDAKRSFYDLKAGNIEIMHYDPKNGRFNGWLHLGLSPFGYDGAVARDGLTAQFNSPAGLCRLTFAGENGGYLIGGLTCGKFSIPARSALK
jgi:hypothetical protein